MATVLQRVKDKRLTAAQEEESRVIFELGAEGSETMTVKQLKMCLKALGFTVAKGEAHTLVYEFDYTDAKTIGLADFQKIFLSKMLETSEREQFDEAFRVLSTNADQVSIRGLSASLKATAIEDTESKAANNEVIDTDLLRHHMGLQYYDDKDIEAVQEFLHNTSSTAEETCISKAALSAFLRI